VERRPETETSVTGMEACRLLSAVCCRGRAFGLRDGKHFRRSQCRDPGLIFIVSVRVCVAILISQ